MPIITLPVANNITGTNYASEEVNFGFFLGSNVKMGVVDNGVKDPDDRHRFLLRWDELAIPAGSVIHSAKVRGVCSLTLNANGFSDGPRLAIMKNDGGWNTPVGSPLGIRHWAKQFALDVGTAASPTSVGTIGADSAGNPPGWFFGKRNFPFGGGPDGGLLGGGVAEQHMVNENATQTVDQIRIHLYKIGTVTDSEAFIEVYSIVDDDLTDNFQATRPILGTLLGTSETLTQASYGTGIGSVVTFAFTGGDQFELLSGQAFAVRVVVTNNTEPPLDSGPALWGMSVDSGEPANYVPNEKVGWTSRTYATHYTGPHGFFQPLYQVMSDLPVAYRGVSLDGPHRDVFAIDTAPDGDLDWAAFDLINYGDAVYSPTSEFALGSMIESWVGDPDYVASRPFVLSLDLAAFITSAATITPRWSSVTSAFPPELTVDFTPPTGLIGYIVQVSDPTQAIEEAAAAIDVSVAGTGMAVEVAVAEISATVRAAGLAASVPAATITIQIPRSLAEGTAPGGGNVADVLNICPVEVDICVTKEDSTPFSFTIKDEDAVAIDVTGFSFLLTVDPSNEPTDDTTKLFQLTAALTDPANGIITFSPSSVQLDQSPDVYFYDIEQTNGSGDVRTIVKGKFTIEAQVTQ